MDVDVFEYEVLIQEYLEVKLLDFESSNLISPS